MIPVLQTERLTLRGPIHSDAVPLAAFISGTRAEGIGGPWPAEEASDWLDDQRETWGRLGRGSWIVALRQDDIPVGRVGLLDHDRWDEPELAWFLFDGFEGLGYAHEAAIAARAHAANKLNLPPLFSFIEDRNARSKALAIRLGATPEREVVFHNVAMTVYRHPALGAGT